MVDGIRRKIATLFCVAAPAAPAPTWLIEQLSNLGTGVTDALIVNRHPKNGGSPWPSPGSCLLLSDEGWAPWQNNSSNFEVELGAPWADNLLVATTGALCPTLTHVIPASPVNVAIEDSDDGNLLRERLFARDASGTL